ncbi:hypothetical protein ASPZODRAFT_155995 [Penicilliopsis zonata CBS 506.65]|uniref:DNA repair protein rad5 n=1 Tax=Penicilliopsis zonata CBS 506.65 TaxID=1073090 RepID=A0A1L9SV58_9EURO|nr:hypothetical protein ASPZODRAFT_155995 [Penicilliopsis zonata CBS 506.65]OJJ51004.1 hypothetical protein ASPZODRAFT_155995 [Penicilliopsis zonata CBS 506.65]
MNMSLEDLNQRPAKKRRFFVEEELGLPTTTDIVKDADTNGDLVTGQEQWGGQSSLEQKVDLDTASLRDCGTTASDGFDTDLFISIIGERLPPNLINRIQFAAQNDLERAVNIYYDGSWKTLKTPGSSSTAQTHRQQTLPVQTVHSKKEIYQTPALEQQKDDTPRDAPPLIAQPALRYVGAFGVEGWATRSGSGLLDHGEVVNIERARSQPTKKRGRGGKLITNQKADVLTRFTNKRGEEIGRLSQETAEWVSTLVDQKVCFFKGVCVFVPDRLRVNDTIYLQLRCYLRQEAFRHGLLIELDDNRSAGVFEEQETTEEKVLRLRQVALVKLFDEIALRPTSSNAMTEKHKKEGILRSAEIAEQHEKTKKQRGNNEESEEDESPELEDDQLDTLYQKAQSFDFNMPETEPAPTFKLQLRKYQKQALHWMVSKEKDRKMDKGRSMHPLWEEYTWPLKDVDDKDLPPVEGVDHFYVNPYSGELSLNFPVQEQHCLGGILADEMGLGKTIEMMSLIHTHKTSLVEQQPKRELHSQYRQGATPAPYTTLVVAPTSLLSQWESEAYKASQDGSMKVLMYYGADRSINMKELCSNPSSAPTVIITSYGVVLSEFRQDMLLNGLFSVDFFRIILDEAHIIKNRRSKTARACYDLKATHRWVLTGTPIVNRLEDLFSLVRFLKVEPWSNFSFWKTFITVPFESKDYIRALNVVQTVLEPLVLRRTKTMKTPEGEPLVPLPRRTITIQEVELSDQEREIYDLIFTRAKRTFNENVEAGTLLKSFSTIFAQILRLRQTCCHPILTRNKAIVADEEDAAAAANEANGLKDDMDLQELIDQFTTATESADSDQQSGSMMKFSAHALRQIQNESSGECPICSEEPMIDPAVTACWHSACKKCLEDFIRHQTDKGVAPRCFSCRGPINSRDMFEVIRHKSPNSTPAEEDLYSSTPPASSHPTPRISLRRVHPLSPSAHTSAKIHALLNHLTCHPPGVKSVVFSQFTTFLDVISPQLAKAGISHLRLDGTMPQKARAEVLAQFTKTETYVEEEDIDDEGEPQLTQGKLVNAKPAASKKAHASSSSPSVLLISLRAGGVGLNLTAANHVYMMDPWWSFAIEAQAIDRVHRMGQLRDVNVTRFVVKNSIEGRMLRVQERKMNIAGSLGLRVGGDGSEDERKKERIEELKLLFE